jgi:hypothetical protein
VLAGLSFGLNYILKQSSFRKNVPWAPVTSVADRIRIGSAFNELLDQGQNPFAKNLMLIFLNISMNSKMKLSWHEPVE